MTSIPASRSARAMIFAPRSWPSRPGFATTTRIFLVLVPASTAGESTSVRLLDDDLHLHVIGVDGAVDPERALLLERVLVGAGELLLGAPAPLLLGDGVRVVGPGAALAPEPLDRPALPDLDPLRLEEVVTEDDLLRLGVGGEAWPHGNEHGGDDHQ